MVLCAMDKYSIEIGPLGLGPTWFVRCVALSMIVSAYSGTAAWAGTTKLVRPGSDHTTWNIIVHNVLHRDNMLPVGTQSYIDQVLIVKDGASGTNTEILSVSCEGIAAYGGHWNATGVSLVQHNGVNHRYRVQLQSANLQGEGWHGAGSFRCTYQVRVKNKSDAVFAARASAVYNMDGSVRNAVSVLHTRIASWPEYSVVGPYNPVGVPIINVAGQNTPDVVFTNGNTVVTQQEIDVVATYADSVRLDMGEMQNDVLKITGTGANYMKWSWSYAGDTRMFDLVENNQTVPVNGTPRSYSGSVGIQAHAQNGQWGIWSGNINITVDAP